jgi:hypothetical protein
MYNKNKGTNICLLCSARGYEKTAFREEGGENCKYAGDFWENMGGRCEPGRTHRSAPYENRKRFYGICRGGPTCPPAGLSEGCANRPFHRTAVPLPLKGEALTVYREVVRNWAGGYGIRPYENRKHFHGICRGGPTCPPAGLAESCNRPFHRTAVPLPL